LPAAWQFYLNQPKITLDDDSGKSLIEKPSLNLGSKTKGKEKEFFSDLRNVWYFAF